MLTLKCATAESAECETVTLDDLSVCAPPGNTLTTGDEYLRMLSAWNDCTDGTTTVGCDEAAEEWYSAHTGCTSCGAAAGHVELAFRVSCTARLIWTQACQCFSTYVTTPRCVA